MTIHAVIVWTQNSIKTAVTKVQNTPEYPSDASLAIPTTLVYADNLKFDIISAGFKLTLWDMKINVMIPRGDLATTMAWLDGVPEAIADIFRNDPTFGANAQTYGGTPPKPVTAQFARETRGAIEYIGYVITVPDIKLSE
jgi:hypothetical protein